MIVRELLGKVGLDVKEQDFKKADKAFNSMGTALKGVIGLLSAGAITAGFTKMINMASDAEETMNVLNAAFGENEKDVITWSEVTAKAMGRSKYAMQTYAGELGSLIQPMIGNRKQAADMSKSLAELTVDLGSFFNKAEPDVLRDLRSALAGSTETVLKYGVNLQVAALQEFAHSKGLRKKVNQMTNAEKVMLRYQLLMEKTKNAQGDAVKTGDGYANMLKRFEASYTDVITTMGKEFLPIATKVLKIMSESIFAFAEATKNVDKLNIFIAALVTGLGWLLVAQWKNIAAFILWAAPIIAIILLIEEIITAFEGGETAIGRFFKKAEEWSKKEIDPESNWLVKLAHILAEAWALAVDGIWQGFVDFESQMEGFTGDIGLFWNNMLNDMLTYSKEIIGDILSFFDPVVSLFDKVLKFHNNNKKMVRNVLDTGEQLLGSVDLTGNTLSTNNKNINNSSKVDANITINAAPGMNVNELSSKVATDFEILLSEANGALGTSY